MRETAGVTLRTIVRYAREQGGDVAVARLLALADATELPEVYEAPRRWWSRDFKIRMFEAAAVVFADDDIATKIGASVFDRTLGTPLRFSLSIAGGPSQVFRHVTKANRKFNTCGDM